METSDEAATIEIEDDSSSDMEVDSNDILPKNNFILAEQTKNAGNDEYKAQNYQAALKLYSDAINLSPDTAAYYGNRAACHIMLGNYGGALMDARTSIQIDKNFEKGYVRIVKCCLSLGDVIGAEQAINKLLEIDSNTTCVKNEQEGCLQLRQLEQKIQDMYDRKVYRTVVFFLDSALKIAPACLKYKLLKAECLALLGRIEEAGDIAITAMKQDTSSADAVYVRGLCLYYNDNIEKGIIHFERALQLDPDHSKAKEMRIKSKNLKEKKEKGNMLFKSGKFREAQALYTEALDIDPLNQEINSKLYYNRALVSSKIGNLREAVKDCTKVLEIKDTYLKALLLRARCYNDLENFEDCVRDYESALKLQKTPDIKKLLRDAKIALKRSKTRKDYYKILGIPKNASDDEIKKAYRKKALQHHPDRHVSSSDVDKKEEERKFKEIGEAYAVLSDPQKKMCHDTGQDIDDDQPNIDPEQLFRRFFQFSDNTGFQFEF